MILGFGKKNDTQDVEERVDFVLFKGAVSGKPVNLKANAKLASAGLPSAKELITDALERRAETIRVEPRGERSNVTFVIDGVPYSGGRMGKPQGLALTQVLKLLAGLDIKVRTKPQAGGIKAEFNDEEYILLVDSTPLKGGIERLRVRVRREKEELNTPDDLGFPDVLKPKIREMASRHRGLVLVCGPPDSGTTTMCYCTLRSLDAYLYALYTVGNTEGHTLTNITAFDVNEGDDLATTLKRCIRVEAHVIFLDPIGDAEIAKAALECHKQVTMLSEITAKDLPSGILQMVKWVGDPKLVAEGLEGLVGQRLIRKLCPECKEAYRPNPKLLKRVGLPGDTKILHRKAKPIEPTRRGEEIEPCETCGDIGYVGRVAVFEYLEMTDAMRKVVADGGDAAAIKTQQRKEKMLTLQQDALRHVANGLTSLEELQRFFKA